MSRRGGTGCSIKTFPFTAVGNIINLLYGPFRKIKEVIKFLILSPLKTGFPLRYNKYPVSLHYLHHNIFKLGSKFTILAYIDSYTSFLKSSV